MIEALQIQCFPTPVMYVANANKGPTRVTDDLGLGISDDPGTVVSDDHP